jgi:hypothetical protein
MFVSRNETKANMVIELDQAIDTETLQKIESFSWVGFVRLVEPMTEHSSRYEK